jgi:hypothetical protein
LLTQVLDWPALVATATSPQKKRAKRGKVSDGASKNVRAKVSESVLSASAPLAGIGRTPESTAQIT